MEYKWYDIRKKIVAACRKTFAEQGVKMAVDDIEMATDLFDSVASFPLRNSLLGNLQANMQKSLQRAFIDEVGESTDLRNVLSLMDPYLKKLLLMSGTKTWKQISRERHNLKLLLQDTGASTTFCTIKHTIKGDNIEQYNHDPSGAYILCVAYLGRNEWHDSPEWDAEDVYRAGIRDQGDRNFYTHFQHNILTYGRVPPCKA